MTDALLTDQEIDELLKEHQFYPEKLALLLWDWGELDLLGIARPDEFQMQFLAELGRLMRSRNFNFIDAARIITMAIGSGRGIGKSALISIVVVILLASFPDAKITLTANTESQLDSKTWPEVRSWLQSSLIAHWFDDNANFIRRKGAEQTWFAAKSVWNLDKPQAFAGQHNRRSINVVIFDEASTIPHEIWDVTIGGLKTGLPIFIATGNMTEATGDFVDAIDGNGIPFDYARSIDARDCRFPNKETIAAEVKQFGEDSDYVRIWIRGMPPKSASGAYFPASLIQESQTNRNPGLATDALIACVDFAWGGADANKVRFFHGLDGYSIPPITVEGERTEKPGIMIAILADALTAIHKPAGKQQGTKVAMLFGDGSGICSQVFRGLRDLGLKNIMEVNFGAHALNMTIHKNMKAQMMANAKEWIQAGGGLDVSKELADDMRHIIALTYSPLQFEDKKKLRERLGRSTDDLDCLIMRGYMPVILPDVQMAAAGWRTRTQKPYKPASAYS